VTSARTGRRCSGDASNSFQPELVATSSIPTTTLRLIFLEGMYRTAAPSQTSAQPSCTAVRLGSTAGVEMLAIAAPPSREQHDDPRCPNDPRTECVGSGWLTTRKND
jgi:hypothetical protein